MTHEAGLKAANKAFWEHPIATDADDTTEVEAAIQAYLSASGMVLVPREPDEEALDRMNTGFWFDPDDAKKIWVALVSSSPDPFNKEPEVGRCGECKTEGWVKGDIFPPCDDSYCTFSYWEKSK